MNKFNEVDMKYITEASINDWIMRKAKQYNIDMNEQNFMSAKLSEGGLDIILNLKGSEFVIMKTIRGQLTSDLSQYVIDSLNWLFMRMWYIQNSVIINKGLGYELPPNEAIGVNAGSVYTSKYVDELISDITTDKSLTVCPSVFIYERYICADLLVFNKEDYTVRPHRVSVLALSEFVGFFDEDYAIDIYSPKWCGITSNITSLIRESFKLLAINGIQHQWGSCKSNEDITRYLREIFMMAMFRRSRNTKYSFKIHGAEPQIQILHNLLIKMLRWSVFEKDIKIRPIKQDVILSGVELEGIIFEQGKARITFDMFPDKVEEIKLKSMRTDVESLFDLWLFLDQEVKNMVSNIILEHNKEMM